MTVPVALLGATGAVGQRFVQLLAGHPEFRLSAVTASPDSVGSTYGDAVDWHLDTPVPSAIEDLEVRPTDPTAIPDDVTLLFSSLPSSVAADVEPAFAEAGYVVSSNSSNERLADDVPLVIPEVNPEHLGVIDRQRRTREWDGALVKNPNCSTIAMVPTLSALTSFGLDRVHVATLQAVSGAGYDGVPSMAIIDNVIPHIDGEEAKMEQETTKLLGTRTGDGLHAHDVTVSASCNRVPTIDGHLENVWVTTDDSLTVEAAREAFQAAPSIDLPSAPDNLIEVATEPDRPQPRLDRLQGDGMTITVGGIQTTADGLQYNCLVHNTIRGAAGASLLNGELLAREGYL
ncbi:MAG: aspartate-semialdehyde dehydrogenase [Halobacteriaceae archaeon]